jgi:hypothetical protein
MPYIGNDIQYGELNSQTFTGDGSTTAFTLTYTVSNVNSLLVTVADVIQEPTTAYTVSGTTLTFTSAPANSDTIHVRYLGRTLDVGTTAIVQDSDQDTKIQVEESADEDTIRFDTGGTERVTINSTSLTSTTPLYIPDGSASAPSVTNTGDTNTGIFFPAADTVGVAVGGTEVWRYGSNPTTAKNITRNGAMTVAQRGTLTGQGGANQTYTAVDGWASFWYQGTEQGRFTTSQDTDVPAGSGFGYSLKIDCTTAEAAVGADEAIILNQPIEAQNLQHLDYGAAGAKTLTLSFWWKSPKTGIQCVQLHQTDAGRGYVREFTVASADTWEFFTVTFPGDASGTINNDTGSGLQLRFPLFAGTNRQMSADAWTATTTDYATNNQQNLLDNTANNIYLTGVQLEVGSVATDFEHEDIGVTLRRCQRYLLSVGDNAYGPALAYGPCVAGGSSGLTTAFDCTLFYPVTMRASPTYSGDADIFQGVFAGVGKNPTGGGGGFFSGACIFNLTGTSGLTVGDAGYWVYRGGKSGFLSAEL